jgi:hypothetical protein
LNKISKFGAKNEQKGENDVGITPQHLISLTTNELTPAHPVAAKGIPCSPRYKKGRVVQEDPRARADFEKAHARFLHSRSKTNKHFCIVSPSEE